MRDLGHGSGYRYAHDEPDAVAAGERYFPETMPDRRYYSPTARGLDSVSLKRWNACANYSPAKGSHDRSKLLRASPDEVARNLARRGYTLDVAALEELEGRRRHWQIETDRLRAARNAHAKSVGQARGRGEDIAPLTHKGEELAQQLVGAEQAFRRGAGGSGALAAGSAQSAARIGPARSG